MKKFNLLSILFLLLISLACTENTENLVSAPDDDDDNTNEPTEEVSYATAVQPIFDSSCTSCHGSNGGLNLSSYSALMNSVGNNYGNDIIVEGDADASGLVDKIEPNPQFGSRMPTGGALTSTEIKTIRDWINEGAKNN